MFPFFLFINLKIVIFNDETFFSILFETMQSLHNFLNQKPICDYFNHQLYPIIKDFLSILMIFIIKYHFSLPFRFLSQYFESLLLMKHQISILIFYQNIFSKLALIIKLIF